MYLTSPERSSWAVRRSPGTPALGGEEEDRAAEEQARKRGRVVLGIAAARSQWRRRSNAGCCRLDGEGQRRTVPSQAKCALELFATW